MKLIFLLVLSFFYLSESVQFHVQDYITKDKSFSSSYISNFFCVYLDTNEFDADVDEIRIYATVYDGNFYKDAVMYYEETDITPIRGTNVNLTSYKISYESSYSGFENSYHYSEYTKYFYIPRKHGRYLYISFPNYIAYSIEIGVSHGLPIWAIVLIVFGVIIVIGIIIVAFICFRRKRNPNYYSPTTNNVFQPPVATYAQPAPAYPPTYQPPVQPNYYG